MSRACLGPRPSSSSSSSLFHFICSFPILISFCTIFSFEGEKRINLDRNPVGSSVVRLRFAVLTLASTLFFYHYLLFRSPLRPFTFFPWPIAFCCRLFARFRYPITQHPRVHAPFTSLFFLFIFLLLLLLYYLPHVARQRPARISTELKIEVDTSPFESWSRVEGKSKEVRVSRFPSLHPFFFSSDFSRGT